jgi:hypothetical protein
MHNVQSSAQAMQVPLQKHWTEGAAMQSLAESKQLLKNGRLASIKFGNASESQDYTSEAKSNFID